MARAHVMVPLGTAACAMEIRHAREPCASYQSLLAFLHSQCGIVRHFDVHTQGLVTLVRIAT